MEVVRVGSFNLIADVGYLEHDAGEGSISELLRQPDGRVLGSAGDLFEAESGYVAFGLDVTRGGILGCWSKHRLSPRKVDQGGIVGYSILALGAVGLLIAIWRFMGLSSDSRKSLPSSSVTPPAPIIRWDVFLRPTRVTATPIPRRLSSNSAKRRSKRCRV